VLARYRYVNVVLVKKVGEGTPAEAVERPGTADHRHIGLFEEPFDEPMRGAALGAVVDYQPVADAMDVHGDAAAVIAHAVGTEDVPGMAAVKDDDAERPLLRGPRHDL
jgi:hypothetical protein